MMLRTLPIAAMALLAACGQSNEEALQDAANQSDPAAAAVLENAAENGMDPQAALEAAGQAQVANGVDNPQAAIEQARPNTAQDPNPPAAGRPVETVGTDSR